MSARYICRPWCTTIAPAIIPTRTIAPVTAMVRDYLGTLEGVTEVHDLHIWAMSTNETALTAHLVRPGGHDDAFLHHVCAELSHCFKIHHARLQVEISSDACRLAPAESV